MGGDTLCGEEAVGESHSLVIREVAAQLHLGDQPVVGLSDDVEADQAVCQQHAMTGENVGEELVVADWDDVALARDRYPARVDLVALLETDGTCGKLADPQLGALDILEDGDRSAGLLGCLPNPSGQRSMELVITVGEVEPSDIHPGFDETHGYSPRRLQPGPASR